MEVELIERLAEEAGIDPGADRYHDFTGDGITHESMVRFAALVAEECAKLVDTAATEDRNSLAQLASPLEKCAGLVAESQTQKLAASIRAKFPMPKEQA